MFVSDELHRILAAGNFSVTYRQLQMSKKKINFFLLFKNKTLTNDSEPNLMHLAGCLTGVDT